MVYCKAAVHDNFDALCLQAVCNVRVADAYLHPDENGFDLEHGIEQRWYVLRAPKDVYDIDGSGGGGGVQIRMHRLTHGNAPHRMNGDDGISRLLKVRCHSMAGPLGFAAQANHCNTASAAKNLGKP
jgi:hypothetical protein